MALTLPKHSDNNPEPKKTRSPLQDRTLSDISAFVEHCHAFGLKSNTIIKIVDNDGNTYGITGFTIRTGIIKIGKD